MENAAGLKIPEEEPQRETPLKIPFLFLFNAIFLEFKMTFQSLDVTVEDDISLELRHNQIDLTQKMPDFSKHRVSSSANT